MNSTSATISNPTAPSSTSQNPSNSNILQKNTALSKSRPHTLHHRISTAIYNDADTPHLLEAFLKSSSSFQFELISYIAVPMLNPQSRTIRLNKNLQKVNYIFSHEKTAHQLSFRLKCLGPSNLNFLSSLLKNANSLTSLNLDLSNLKAASTSSLHSLNLALKHLKHLSHLTLSFSQASHLTYNLLSSLKTLRSLSNLSLNISAPKYSNLSSFFTWPKYLTHLSQLSALSLALMECVFLTDQDLAVLFSHFNKLTQINTITISLHGALNCTVEGLSHFFSNIKDLKKLSKICLDIFAFKLYNHHEVFAAGFAKVDPTLLQELTLDVSETDFTDEGLIALCTVLENFQSLKKLNLTLARNEKILHYSLEKLALSLGKLCSLISLELHLADLENYDDEYSQETMGIISSGLSGLHQLRYLGIDFTNLTQTRDEDLQELAQNLKNLLLLEKLCFVFNSCRNLTDKGIKDLAESLKSLNNLRILFLDFSYANLMTNASLVNLADGIKGLAHLKDLELHFLFCQGINIDGLKALAEGFESLGALYNVNLSFPRSVAAGGNTEGLERMFEVFEKLNSLRIIAVGVESMYLSDSESGKFKISGKEVNLCML